MVRDDFEERFDVREFDNIEERLAWDWLEICFSFGVVTFNKLFDKFGTKGLKYPGFGGKIEYLHFFSEWS